MPQSVAAILPVLDEEEAIGPLVRTLVGLDLAEVIVVDGGSRDRTIVMAEEAGARVVIERRRGYGRACASGAAAASADVLAFLDGDGADDPSALPLLLQPVCDGRADLALGARSRMEAGALPWHAVLGNRLAAALISLLWRQSITDLPSFKVIRRRRLIELGMTEATYGWTIEMIVKAARHDFRIVEVQLDYRRRKGGVSKVSGNLRASAKAAWAILSTLSRHALGVSSGSLPIIEAP